MVIHFLCIIWLVLAVGCSGGEVRLDSGDHPLAKIKHAVKKSLPLDVRLVSENGREFYSEYFIERKGRVFKATKMGVRKYAHVVILGERRPYTITTQVLIEKRLSSKGMVKAEYEFVKYDEVLARALLKRIYKILNESRDDGNIVDDFRVF